MLSVSTLWAMNLSIMNLIYMDNVFIGRSRSTSGAYGYSLDKDLLLGYVDTENFSIKDMKAAESSEIEFVSKRYKVNISKQAFYDHKGIRMQN